MKRRLCLLTVDLLLELTLVISCFLNSDVLLELHALWLLTLETTQLARLRPRSCRVHPSWWHLLPSGQHGPARRLQGVAPWQRCEWNWSVAFQAPAIELRTGRRRRSRCHQLLSVLPSPRRGARERRFRFSGVLLVQDHRALRCRDALRGAQILSGTGRGASLCNCGELASIVADVFEMRRISFGKGV